MKCPIDDTDLQMTERQGVEIDFCPQCRGVWLDRGELDKIIDRTQAPGLTTSANGPTGVPGPQSGYQPQRYGKHGRRKSLLGELFDF